MDLSSISDPGKSLKRTTKVHLEVPTDVIEAFGKSQHGKIRFLKLTTNIDHQLIVNNISESESGPEHDFQIILLQSILTENEAAYLLYCLDDFNDGLCKDKLSWLLITWIPDGCRKRDKMLFSNTIGLLKSTLGSGLIKSDYPANAIAHLTWENYQNSLRSTPILGKNELLEKQLLESAGTGHQGFDSLAFRVDTSVRDALVSFQMASIGDWYEFQLLTDTVKEETLAFNASKQLKSFSTYQSLFDKEEPRFILTRLPQPAGGSVFALLLSCPDSASSYKKVTAAACKARLLKECQDSDISVDKLVEFGGSEDDQIDTVMQQYVFDDSNSSLQGFDVIDGGATLQVSLMHTKPSRPGKKRFRR